MVQGARFRKRCFVWAQEKTGDWISLEALVHEGDQVWVRVLTIRVENLREQF